MSDRALRELERRWRSDPGDAVLAQRLAAILRREHSGGDDAVVPGGCAFDSSWKLDLWVRSPNGKSRYVGTTPDPAGPLRLPEHSLWWVTPHSLPDAPSELRALVDELAAQDVPGVDLRRLGHYTNDDQLRALCSMSQLRRLGLRGTSISDAGLNALVHLWGLEELDVSGCHQVTTAGLEALESALAGLRVLDLSNRRPASLAFLANLEDLRDLDLSGRALTEEDLGPLGDLPWLRGLSVAFSGLSGLRGLTSLQGWLGRAHPLRRLDARGTRINGEELAQSLPWLEDLRVDDHHTLWPLCSLRSLAVEGTDPGDLSWLRFHPRLEELELTADVADDALARLSCVPALRVLRLRRGLTDQGLHQLIRSAPRLEELQFHAGPAVSEWGVGALIGLPQLRRLAVIDESPGQSVRVALRDLSWVRPSLWLEVQRPSRAARTWYDVLWPRPR